jgi:hypothetical protein
MRADPDHEVANLERRPGELSFEARVGGRAQRVWMRTATPLMPSADAALAACLMPAMRSGGTLRLSDPVSPRLLRTQREFQAIQRAWSLDWPFGDPPLRELEVVAPTEVPPEPDRRGRVAAFFSGGVDSWSAVLDNPEVTDLIFVRGIDILPRLSHQAGLADEVEARLREVADELGLPLHVVETNLRELSDPLLRWETYCACANVSVALFLAPLFERILIASDTDHETQPAIGPGRLVDQLWSTERLELVDEGGRRNREQRLRAIERHPLVRKSLRVCWENPDGAYNCGRCRKCLLTMISLEAHGALEQVETFPSELDLGLLEDFEIFLPISLALWEDLLDSVRGAGRPDLERPLQKLIPKGRRALGVAPTRRRRRSAGPPATVRTAVIIPVWRQGRYLASAVGSALAQEIVGGVGVVIVDDGCPDPETDRIGGALRDASPERVAYLRQPNRGVSAARNAGIRHAFARWPQVETIFPLDADNMLSPHTLAQLSLLLEEHPEAAWASPVLEFFGAEAGEWQVPGPYLPYRQLFTNQSDTGSLIRRAVFEAGISYEETIRYGFEDWELFLRATLSGFTGMQAGRCGFRYRCRPDSMIAAARARRELLEADIHQRHAAAYEPRVLTRREHAEAPRFALVRCDRRDVLLTADCDLEPRRLTLADFTRSLAAAGGAEPTVADHVPAVTVLTSAATIASLEAAERLPETLFRLQSELHGRGAVGLSLGAGQGAGLGALAVRGSALDRFAADALPEPEALVELDGAGPEAEPLPEPEAGAAAALIAAAAQSGGMSLAEGSHSRFFEHLHLDQRQTTFPASGSRRAAA